MGAFDPGSDETNCTKHETTVTFCRLTGYLMTLMNLTVFLKVSEKNSIHKRHMKKSQ
jgi:hypothetical protein